MNADNIKVVFFFFYESIQEFRSAQNVVDEDIVEEFDVCPPFLKVINDEERENVACISDQRSMHLYAFEDFSGFQIAFVQREDRDVMSDVDELVGYVFRVSAQSANECGWILPDEKANPQLQPR